MYCPPGTNSGLPLINEAKTKTIIAGDFNAHLPELGYERYNNMGREVEALNIENHIHLLQNEQSQPTCLHRRHSTTSRPDLTFVSADIHNKTNIKIIDDIGSDHLAILTTIDLRQQKRSRAQRKTFWNFKKANWKAYREKTNIELENIDQNQPIEQLCLSICSTTHAAAKKTVPQGIHKKFKAFWTSEISDAVKQRQKARKTAEKDPSTQNKREYNKLTAKVRHLTKSAKQEAWKNNCKKLDLNREGHKTWRLLNNLEGKSIKTNPQPLIQDRKEIVCDKRKAEEFNKYFANVNKQERRDTLDSHLWRAAKKNNPAPRHKHMAFETPFNLAVCLFGFLTSSSTTRLYRGRAPRQERLTILRAATHETELGDHDFCLSRSHYTDTDPTCRERAATAGIEPGTSSPGVARSTAELPRRQTRQNRSHKTTKNPPLHTKYHQTNTKKQLEGGLAE